jgi:Mrp family chromosome partitioning ATPase
MGLIERLDAAASAQRRAAPAASAAAEFDIDFGKLERQGLYSPGRRASRLALELRIIKRNLLRRLGVRHGSVRPIAGSARNLVLFTSSRAGEGKTFAAVNLALSLACEDGVEVLLIDADEPRPKVAGLFGLPDAPGLTETLASGSPLYAARARQAPLTVVPAGSATQASFSSQEARRLFSNLSAEASNRVVFVDAPPVLPAPDAVHLARLAGEVVFVVEAESTPHAAVAAALDELLDANPNVSLLLNRCLVGPGRSYAESYADYAVASERSQNRGNDSA